MSKNLFLKNKGQRKPTVCVHRPYAHVHRHKSVYVVRDSET